VKSSPENKAPTSEERTLNEIYSAAESTKMIFTPETPAIHRTYVRHIHALKKVAAHARATDPVKKQMAVGLRAAKHALRSYEFGNTATDLAKEIADRCENDLQAYEKEQNGLEVRP
jgi:hypothetical protein